jgi:hypothetical protein
VQLSKKVDEPVKLKRLKKWNWNVVDLLSCCETPEPGSGVKPPRLVASATLLVPAASQQALP